MNPKLKRMWIIRRDESGGLEGLPLYMIILVTITVLALIAIIVLIPQPIVPEYMTFDPKTVCWDETTQVTITVYSADDDPINGATVVIDGPAVSDTDKTSGGGKVEFTVTPHTENPNPAPDTIDVTASFNNVQIGNDIPVKMC